MNRGEKIMGFIFKEKTNKLNAEEQKELIRALAEGLPADRIYDIFKIDKEFLENFKNEVYEDEARTELEYEREHLSYSSLIYNGGMSGFREKHLGKEAFA